MKTAVGVVFTAALATALPPLSSRDTRARTESKLPWIPYNGSSVLCGQAVRKKPSREKIEKACGTEGFCDLFNLKHGAEDVKRFSEKYGYANNIECYGAHDKIPWVENKGDYGACRDATRALADREDFEDACGTEGFCDSFDPSVGAKGLKRFSENYGFTNKTECYDLHARLPWIKPKEDSRACKEAIRSLPDRKVFEVACGTEGFCESFNPENSPQELQRFSERYFYLNSMTCYRAHDKKPWIEYKDDHGGCRDAVRSKPRRQKFEDVCGTEGFC